MTDPATIRTMRAGETAVVADLVVAANAANLATFPPDVAEGYRAELAASVGRLAGAEVYVAERGGRVVGTVTFLPDAGDDRHPWPPGGSVMRFLAVAPEAQRQGVGRRLSEACVERARDVDATYVGLHTAPVMAAARRLYEHLGFERAPEHDFDPRAHYGGPAPAADADDLRGLAYVLRL